MEELFHSSCLLRDEHGIICIEELILLEPRYSLFLYLFAFPSVYVMEQGGHEDNEEGW